MGIGEPMSGIVSCVEIAMLDGSPEIAKSKTVAT